MANAINLGRDSQLEYCDQFNDLVIDYSDANQPVYSSGKSGGVWRVLGLDFGRVASASYDHLARIHSMEKIENSWRLSPKEINLNQHKKEVLSLVQIGNKLLSGSSDGLLCLWNLHDGKLYDSWKEKRINGIYSIAVLNDEMIATGSCQKPKGYKGDWNHVIKVWNVTSHKFHFEMKGHTGGVSALVSKDDAHIASSSGDKTVRLWDLVKRTSCCSFNGHTDYVYGLCQKDNMLISSSRDRSVRLWDIREESEVGHLAIKGDTIAHTSSVYDVKVRNNTVLTCSRDGFVKVWDLRTGNCCATLDPSDGFVYGVDFMSDERIAAGTSGVCSKDKEENKRNANVVVWDFSVK